MSVWTQEPWKLTLTPLGAKGLTKAVVIRNTTRMISDFGRSAQAETDALRVVDAVNGCAGLNPSAYRAVVEALKEALEVTAFGGSPSTALGRCIRDWEPKAKAALRLAEQEGTT